MTDLYQLFAITLGPMVLLFAFIEWRIRRREGRARARQAEAARLGLDEPASLHPYIDPNRCIGSGACVRACPEHDVLGLIGGRGELIHAANCVGHGACAVSCPVGAITLVFGTSRRGVDIPRISARFETTVPGIYLAGEIGGMGLLHNAAVQGRQAMEALRDSLADERLGRDDAAGAVDLYDVVIAGAGPAGLSAAYVAREAGLRYVVCEQEDPGGAVLHYPRGKIILTRPFTLAEQPPIPGPRLSKEALMDLVESASRGLEIRARTRLVGVEGEAGAFTVKLDGGDTLGARRVLLAVGRRGTPRKLGAPGEDQAKVVYRLTEPGRYAGQDVLVVGGGSSAVESVLMLGEVPGTTARLSYRGDAFRRVPAETRERLDAAVAAGRVELLLQTEVARVEYDAVVLTGPEGERRLANDAIIVQIGGTVPTALLRGVGVLVDVHRGVDVEASDED